MNEKGTIVDRIFGFTLIGLAGIGTYTIICNTYKCVDKIITTRKIEKCTKMLKECTEVLEQINDEKSES